MVPPVEPLIQVVLSPPFEVSASWTEVPLLIFSKPILMEDPLTERVVEPTVQIFPTGLFQHSSGFVVLQGLNPSSRIQYRESLHPLEAYLS